ncbi:hypothetical protein BRPE64_CCDS05290 [Caballeronia insecticola]|uniref:Uncharacterized protein n=1 Tax=Caballeronia insecticola TaxID=758793 RepID=R4X3Q9_9BURK|nr:hypothetical protein BRPE64_CCDS05290 [Caballeronia insecticola]
MNQRPSGNWHLLPDRPVLLRTIGRLRRGERVPVDAFATPASLTQQDD